MRAERNQEFRFMRPLGARKTRHHICGHQDCAICRPCWPAKGGRSAENREAEKQASLDSDLTPDDELTPEYWDGLMAAMKRAPVAEDAPGEGPDPFL